MRKAISPHQTKDCRVVLIFTLNHIFNWNLDYGFKSGEIDGDWDGFWHFSSSVIRTFNWNKMSIKHLPCG